MTKKKTDLDRRAEIGRERRARTRANIVDAAFRVFGQEAGLHAKIEDIAKEAGVTRATFYNHFAGMAELLEAVSYELTHELRSAVISAATIISDPRARAATATRMFLHKARRDRSWAWSMINISSSGIIFGAETFKNARLTVQRGIDEGYFDVPDARVGRDLIMGASLAAFGTMTREEVPEDFPDQLACRVLIGLGLDPELAKELVSRKLPELKIST
jgi:AcrR family transcriptional regulator